MKCKELIKRLKREDPDLEVGMAMGDNSEGEVAGWVHSVFEEDEINMDTDRPTGRRVIILIG